MIYLPSAALKTADSPAQCISHQNGATLYLARFSPPSLRAAEPSISHPAPPSPQPHLEPSAHSRRSRFNQPELDALRFFAFGLVFCDHLPLDKPWFHALHESGGFGVALFFCLSAYLITTLMLLEREHTGTVSLRAFAIRRALRVLPLYLLLVALGTIMGLFWPTIRLDPKYFLALLLFCANIFCQYFLWIGVGCLAPLWSLSVEVQFYIVAALTARLRKRSLAITWVLITAASYALLLHFGRARYNPVFRIWPNTLVQFQFFAAGVTVALLLFHRALRLPLPARTAFALSGLALFYIAGILCGIHSTTAIPTSNLLLGYLCELAGVVAIFLAFLHLPLAIPRWLVYLGKISYGLYGFHSLLLWFTFSNPGALSPSAIANQHPVTAVLVVLAATIAISTLSYELFEKPILRRKQRFEPEPTRL